MGKSSKNGTAYTRAEPKRSSKSSSSSSSSSEKKPQQQIDPNELIARKREERRGNATVAVPFHGHKKRRDRGAQATALMFDDS